MRTNNNLSIFIGVVIGSYTFTAMAAPLSLIEYIQQVQSRSFESQLQNNQSLLTSLDHQQQLDSLAFSWSPNFSVNKNSSSRSATIGFNLNKPINSTVSSYLSSSYQKRDYTAGEEVYNTNLELGFSLSLLRSFDEAYRNKTLINAQLTKKIKDISLNIQQQELLYTAYSTYVKHQQLQRLFVLSEEALSRAESNYASANARFLTGLVAKSDVYRAQSAYTQARLSQRSYFNNLLDSQQSLNQLANSQVQVAPLTETSIYTFKKPSVSVQQIPEIQLREIDKKLAFQQVKLAHQELKPNVTLNTAYRQLSDSLEANQFDFEDEFTVGLSVESSFNFTSRKRSFDRAKIALNNKEIDYQIREQNIINRIDSLLRDIKWQSQLTESNKQNITLAESTLALLNKRYEKGLISNSEVLEAEDDLVQTKISYTSAVTAHNLAIVNFYKFIGALTFERIQQLEENSLVSE